MLAAVVSRPGDTAGRIVVRAVRAHGRPVEFPRGRVATDSGQRVARSQTHSQRRGSTTARTARQMRHPQNRPFRVRLSQGYRALQRR